MSETYRATHGKQESSLRLGDECLTQGECDTQNDKGRQESFMTQSEEQWKQ